MRMERIGRYRIVRALGSGGMAEVFEGYDDTLRRPVAIKGLLAERTTPERRERLRREALSTAALSHPAIAHVYEIVSEGDRDFVVMEFVRGRPVSEQRRDRPLAAAEIARIGEQVARALAAAHGIGLIHRDVKCENVMITPEGHVKVLDFGLAKWTGPRADGVERLTTEGMVVGTARAMSPEQAMGKELDARSDIFSLGSLLYELASGRSPFAAVTPHETMYKVARADYTPLRRAATGLPAELAAIIERCLERDPDRRFPSALALADALLPLALPASGSSTTVTPIAERRRWLDRIASWFRRG